MLRLLELFAGIGAQRMALDRLGIEYKTSSPTLDRWTEEDGQ